MTALFERYGEAFARRILAPDERPAFAASSTPILFLAKRFAAKEAFGKALGTGVAAPATLHAVRITNDERGKPWFAYGEELARYMEEQRLSAHVSLSDERDYVVAFALI